MPKAGGKTPKPPKKGCRGKAGSVLILLTLSLAALGKAIAESLG